MHISILELSRNIVVDVFDVILLLVVACGQQSKHESETSEQSVITGMMVGVYANMNANISGRVRRTAWKRSGFDPGRRRLLFLSIVPKPTLASTPCITGCSSPLLQSNVEVKMSASVSPLPQVFTALCSIKHSDHLHLQYITNSCINHVSPAVTLICEAWFQISVEEPIITEFSCRRPPFFE
jgi:hypothetical protein